MVEGERQLDSHTSADRALHEATAHIYDETLLPVFGVYYPALIEPILDRLATEAPGRSAIDIGCGTGGVTVRLAERGFEVLGVDHSEAMLAHAEKNVRAQGVIDAVRLTTGDVRALPAADATMDVATCQGVLHHLTDLDPVIGEMRRVLRPGGVIYITDPCHGSTPTVTAWNLGVRFFAALKYLMARIGKRSSGKRASSADELEIPENEEGPIDADALVALLERNSFEVEVAYSNKFEKMERLPRRLQRPMIMALSRPWRRRRGNMVFVTGRRTSQPASNASTTSSASRTA